MILFDKTQKQHRCSRQKFDLTYASNTTAGVVEVRTNGTQERLHTCCKDMTYRYFDFPTKKTFMQRKFITQTLRLVLSSTCIVSSVRNEKSRSSLQHQVK